MPDALSWIPRSAPIVGLVGLLAGPAFAASQQDYDNCSQTNDIKLSINACQQVANTQSETAEDRVNALIQIGNDYYGLNDPVKALESYDAALATAGKGKLPAGVGVPAEAGKAIAEWRLYQNGHDPVHWDRAKAFFGSAEADDYESDGKNFNALVNDTAALQEIKSNIEATKKK